IQGAPPKSLRKHGNGTPEWIRTVGLLLRRTPSCLQQLHPVPWLSTIGESAFARQTTQYGTLPEAAGSHFVFRLGTPRPVIAHTWRCRKLAGVGRTRLLCHSGWPASGFTSSRHPESRFARWAGHGSSPRQ